MVPMVYGWGPSCVANVAWRKITQISGRGARERLLRTAKLAIGCQEKGVGSVFIQKRNRQYFLFKREIGSVFIQKRAKLVLVRQSHCPE